MYAQKTISSCTDHIHISTITSMYNKKCQQTKCLRVCGCVVIEENEKKLKKHNKKRQSVWLIWATRQIGKTWIARNSKVLGNSCPGIFISDPLQSDFEPVGPHAFCTFYLLMSPQKSSLQKSLAAFAFAFVFAFDFSFLAFARPLLLCLCLLLLTNWRIASFSRDCTAFYR